MAESSGLYLYMGVFCFVTLLVVAQDKFYGWKQRDSKILGFFIVMIPSLLSGFRYYVGTDYHNYLNQLPYFPNMTLLGFVEGGRNEVGHFLLTQCARIFDTPYIVFVIYAILTVNFAYEALRYYRKTISFPLGMLLYLCTFFPHSFNVMRQYLAVSLVFFAYRFVFERKFGLYLACVLFAMSLHTSAIIALPLYFIHEKYAYFTLKTPEKLSNFPTRLETASKPVQILFANWTLPEKIRFNYMKCAIYMMIGLFLVFYWDILDYISEIDVFSRYSIYLNTMVGGNNRELYVIALVLTVILVFHRELKTLDPRHEFFLSLGIMGFFFGFLGFLDGDIKRVSLYFDVVRILLIASLPLLFQKKQMKILVSSGVVAYCLGFFVLMFYVLGHSEIFPYQSIFTEGNPLDLVDFADFWADKKANPS